MSCVDEAKLEHEISEIWDKRSHREETVQFKPSHNIEMAQPPQQSRPLLTPRSNLDSESDEWCLHQKAIPAFPPVEVQQGPPFDSI